MLIDKDDLLDKDSFNDFNVSDQERLVIAAIGESGEGKSAFLNLVFFNIILIIANFFFFFVIAVVLVVIIIIIFGIIIIIRCPLVPFAGK